MNGPNRDDWPLIVLLICATVIFTALILSAAWTTGEL